MTLREEMVECIANDVYTWEKYELQEFARDKMEEFVTKLGPKELTDYIWEYFEYEMGNLIRGKNNE